MLTRNRSMLMLRVSMARKSRVTFIYRWKPHRAGDPTPLLVLDRLVELLTFIDFQLFSVNQKHR